MGDGSNIAHLRREAESSRGSGNSASSNGMTAVAHLNFAALRAEKRREAESGVA